MDNVRLEKKSEFEISAVIPLFNKQETSQRAVRSILAQTFPVKEILVIDDGSSDESVARVKRLKDRRIRVMHQENAGPSSARNTGIKAARSEWIAFIDADDEWQSGYLEEICNLYKLNKNCGVLAASYQVVKDDDNPKIYSIPDYPYGWMGVIDDYYAIRNNTIFHHVSSTVCSREDLLTVGGFRDGVHHFEEFLLWLDLAIITIIAYINAPLAIYHSTPSGLSKQTFALDKQLTPAQLLHSQMQDGLIPENLLSSARNLLSKFQLDEARLLYRFGKNLKAINAFFHRQKSDLYEKDWLKFFLVACTPKWLYKHYLSMKGT